MKMNEHLVEINTNLFFKRNKNPSSIHRNLV